MNRNRITKQAKQLRDALDEAIDIIGRNDNACRAITPEICPNGNWACRGKKCKAFLRMELIAAGIKRTKAAGK